jgi:hypothetical protein
MKVTDMVKKIFDAKSFETPQWGLIQLKWVDLAGLDEEKREKAKHRLGELVWRETVTVEVDGREVKHGCEAKVTVGKVNVNEEMKKFLKGLGE